MNVFLGFAGSLILFLPVVVLLLNRRQAARDAAAVKQFGEQATALGLQHQGAFAQTGQAQLAGQSEGVDWTARVHARLGTRGRGSRRAESSLITFPGLVAAPGTFVLAMALPPGTQVPPEPELGKAEGGFLASLAEKASEALLDLCVSGYFGAEHRALVNSAGAARPPGPPGFWILSTDAALLAARLLDSRGQELLVSLKDAEVAQGRTLASTGFGVFRGRRCLVEGRGLDRREVRPLRWPRRARGSAGEAEEMRRAASCSRR